MINSVKITNKSADSLLSGDVGFSGHDLTILGLIAVNSQHHVIRSANLDSTPFGTTIF